MARNAADESQVKEQGNKEKRTRERELSDLAIVLNSSEGRRLFRRLVDFCGVSQSVSRPNALTTSYVAGAQDVGHFIVKEMLEANPGVGVALLADAYRERKDEANE